MHQNSLAALEARLRSAQKKIDHNNEAISSVEKQLKTLDALKAFSTGKLTAKQSEDDSTHKKLPYYLRLPRLLRELLPRRTHQRFISIPWAAIRALRGSRTGSNVNGISPWKDRQTLLLERGNSPVPNTEDPQPQ